MKRAGPLGFLVLCLLALDLSAQPLQRVDGPLHGLEQWENQGYFLRKVYYHHSSLRHYLDSVLLASGFQSPLHRQALDSLRYTDSVLSLHIDAYLSHYDYPDRAHFGEQQCLAPLMVLNSSDDLGLRKKHFSKLLRAYREENLERRRLIEFLERSYELQYQRTFQSYARDEARLSELMRELDLLPLRHRRQLPARK